MSEIPKYKIGLRNRTIAERFTICGRFTDAVAKAPAEKRKGVDMENLQSKRAAAEASEAEIQELQTKLKAAVTRRTQELTAYCNTVGWAAQMVGACAESNVDVLSCGLNLEAPKRPIGLPGAPGNFRAVPFAGNGAVKLRCQRPVRRCFFIMEMTTDPEAKTGWAEVENRKRPCSATRIIDGLQPGVLYWFRICAHNTAGQGPWSDCLSVRPAR